MGEASGANGGGEGGRSESGIIELRCVLVPTDFSPLGQAAIPYAYGLVASGGRVHLLHVIEGHAEPNPLYAHYTPGRTPTREEHERQIADLRARLSALEPAGAAARRVQTEVVIAQGSDVAELVCEQAGRLGVDAICMSTHGRGGVVRAVMGSVAEKVIQHARRPVLVVRPEA